jgi:transcriptional regulator with GAF, ATPase, and Fis domain/tetratricopeptide (TPR) repeat protein
MVKKVIQNNSYNLRQVKESALLKMELAKKALDQGELEAAWLNDKQILASLSLNKFEADCHEIFVPAAIEFSNLCFHLGKGFTKSASYLKSANILAENFGDKRSNALILMHMGRFYYFTDLHQKALEFFARGKKAVEELNDEDILNRSAEFIGFYYYIKGLYREALPHLERAVMVYELKGKESLLNPSGPALLALAQAYVGHFNLAIGTLDYYRRLAQDRGDLPLATTLGAITGFILLMLNLKNEAFNELTRALQDAKKENNDLALYLSSGYLCYHALIDGRPRDSFELFKKNMSRGKKSGLHLYYDSPLIVEQLYELMSLGFKTIPGLKLNDSIHEYLKSPSIHIQGVTHRVLALKAIESDKEISSIEKTLKTSEALLDQSGDPIQLAKTRLELARLMLKKDDIAKAKYYAQKAWYGFSGYIDIFFPDNMRHLLSLNDPDQARQEKVRELNERLISIIQDLTPSSDLDILINKAVAITNRFFGAERGGLLWFEDGKNNGRRPVFRGGYHLTKREVFSDDFKYNLSLIFSAHKAKQPIIDRLEHKDAHSRKIKGILCLPVNIGRHGNGVLYYDNSYGNDCFDLLEKSSLTKLGNALSAYIDQAYEFSKSLKQSSTEQVQTADYPDRFNIIAESPVMKEVLKKADLAASSDSSVLILGETGVGKELLAHRIHHMSKRQGPFVIVDSTTIPENLFESELFGHERGAFTGADRLKIGRMEMAHGGTLFIDEIAEIPRLLQAKFLRVLQEKTLMRLGGTQSISSDFRLLVATNRDLADEVSAGRFREDLYFRLNVVPVTIPPLRERMADLPHLARHFFAKYSTKYGRAFNDLTREDEMRLMDYNWPGNIRELQNIIERAVILSTKENLVIDVPDKFNNDPSQFFRGYPSLDEMQRRYIKYVLDKTGGKISGRGGATEYLGLKRTTLQHRMKKLGIL